MSNKKGVSNKRNSDSAYYSENARDSAILSEFGWNNVQLDAMEWSGRLAKNSNMVSESADVRIPSVQKSCGDASTSVPSVSSSSNEDMTEKSAGSGGNYSQPGTTLNTVKNKGKNRTWQPRFAFVTKSEVDNLEDGYRWRKYGQKAVKNSPFPRSYYRCTNSQCTVKKRVERSYEDQTTVITTYEGQHCHHTVGHLRGGLINNHELTIIEQSQLASPTVRYYSRASVVVQPNQGRVEAAGELHALPHQTVQLPNGEGLLDDIVSPRMYNR